MSAIRYKSIWDAIANTPQEAASLRIRSEFMIELVEQAKQQRLTQEQAAKLYGVTLPRVDELMNGMVERFSLDALLDMATVAGLEPHIKLKKAA